LRQRAPPSPPVNQSMLSRRKMSLDLAKLTPDLRKRVAQELMPGERVVYAGAPDWTGGIGLGAFLFLFGLGWSALTFTAFGISVGAALGFAPPEMKMPEPRALTSWGLTLFLLPFVVVGVGLLSAPALIVYRNRRMAHIVTDRRVMTVHSGKNKGAESYTLDNIISLTRTDGGEEGCGSLLIGHGVERDSDGDIRAVTLDWLKFPAVRRAETAIRSIAPQWRASE
jgi:hypothetical protein